MRTLVTIPTYNEANSILDLAREVLAVSDQLDVLVVDDASPDGTGDRVAEAGRTEPRLKLLRRAGKLGLGSAYQAGFRYGLDNEYDQVFTMDGDGSHDPCYLAAMIGRLDDHDMVIGSRYVPGGGVSNWALRRRVLSSFANFYTRILLRLPQKDCTAGFRGYRREVLTEVDALGVGASGYSFLYEMVWRVHRAGFRIAEVPIIFTDRHFGISKIDRKEIFLAVWHVFVTAVRPPQVERGQGRLPERARTESCGRPTAP